MTGAKNQPILVAVANPDHVGQLVRTAGDLARLLDTGVKIISVTVKPHSSPFSIYTDETVIEMFSGEMQEMLDAATTVAPDDVPVDHEVFVGHSVADGVLKAVADTDARALVIGWHDQRTRTDALLGTNLDRLIERAPCDLYVERIGYEANGVDSVLLPVAGGPHVPSAALAAKAIVVRNDATAHVLSVDASDSDPDAARDHIETAALMLAEAPGPDIRIETLLRTGEGVADVIAETATDHDLLILGATRHGAVRRRIVGSIPQTVIHRTDRTVLLARSGAVVGRTGFGYVERLRDQS